MHTITFILFAANPLKSSVPPPQLPNSPPQGLI